MVTKDNYAGFILNYSFYHIAFYMESVYSKQNALKRGRYDMSAYSSMTRAELEQEYKGLLVRFEDSKKLGLKIGRAHV